MNEGTAITSKITIGMIVHSTSTSVLCVVRDGVGLARALKRTMTMIKSASTKPVIPVMM